MRDHDGYCPHRRPHLSGMEVCRACGDYRICQTCGMEYIWQDSGDEQCWMCCRVDALRAALAQAERDQAARKTQYQAKAS